MVGEHQTKEFVVTEKGVEVTKRLESEEYEIPSIEFAIESERSDRAVVRLVDPLPEAVDVATLGFHPEYGKEHWQVEDDAVIFEREMNPGEGCYTLYGIGTDDTPIEPFLVEPTALDVEQSVDGAPAALGEVIPEVGATESGEKLGTTETDDETPVTLTLPSESNEASDPTENGAAHGNRPAGADHDTVANVTASVVDALVEELQAREASDDAVGTLREELSLHNGSVDARVTKLESELDELRAYTAALEEFLDEHDTGTDLIEDFQDRLAATESDVDDLSATVRHHDDRFDAIDASIDGLDTTVDDVLTQLEDVTAGMDDLESQVADVEAKFPEDEFAADLNEIRADVIELREWHDQVTGAFTTTLDEESEDAAE